MVLIGAGRPHLFLLEALAHRPLVPAANVTVVAPWPHRPNPALAAGLVTGEYDSAEIDIDVAALARRAGAVFIEGTADRLDPESRTVALANGRSIPYDAVSIAIGAGPEYLSVPGLVEHAVVLKPVERALDVVPALERAVEAAPLEGIRVAVVGAGTEGVEMALAIRSRLDRLSGGRGVVTLIEAAHVILPGARPRLIQEAERVLRRRDITLILGGMVREVANGVLTLTNGAHLMFDLLVWSTGGGAPRLYRNSGLPVDRDGYLSLDGYLCCPDVPGVFGAGDTVAIAGFPHADAGVMQPERQARVLYENLAASLNGRAPAARYQPGSREPQFVATGEGRAILSWGDLILSGRWAGRMKDRRERKLMARWNGSA